MKPEDPEQPVLTGQISLTSLVICIGILAIAILNQYLSG
jgi:hypothetical protein